MGPWKLGAGTQIERCCALALCRQSSLPTYPRSLSQPIQSRSTQQVRLVEWDLSEWLTEDPESPAVLEGSDSEANAPESGVKGGGWRGLLRQSQFVPLLQEILRHPADVVMLRLRRHERCVSVVHRLSIDTFLLVV